MSGRLIKLDRGWFEKIDIKALHVSRMNMEGFRVI